MIEKARRDLLTLFTTFHGLSVSFKDRNASIWRQLEPAHMRLSGTGGVKYATLAGLNFDFSAEWISCGIYLLYVYTYRHEVKLIGRAGTAIAFKTEMAAIMAQNAKFGRHGWAPFDDQDREGTGSLLSNDSADAEDVES